ncbi:unnamed protein product [Didymodactylos carnosus]|uniref:Uncharacterized protein n=1 Tax=Didymodactylos carnosus TaxID=1234261 RepID=A0A815R3J7_9BILA|nr:unnamed protein product [Didymodactylos carnosus]CAF1471471.1 unnamed protein product [Didymodactylos carnosus]CAF3574880.1 unnamed protein product [Didymodactylos carnosus]CAF4339039.1 unnamed protein product [Didymodactylos carnosus]
MLTKSRKVANNDERQRSYFGQIGDKVSKLFGGGSASTSEREKREVIVPDSTVHHSSELSTTSASRAPTRSYGFSSTNAPLFSEQESSELYRYKNINRNYLRSSSPPTREESDSDNDDDEQEKDSKKKRVNRK